MTAPSVGARVEGLVRKAASDPRAGEVLWRMRSDDGRVDLTHGDPWRPFFLASATKLFVTSILAQLRSEGRIDWDAPGYLPGLDLAGLVVVRGVDRSGSMTVRQVMAHTSGLADYFEGPRPDGTSTFARVLEHDTTRGGTCTTWCAGPGRCPRRRRGEATTPTPATSSWVR